MFGKILKYDLRAVFKYWWIAALSSVLLSVAAGFCVNILANIYTEYDILYILAGIGIFISIIGIVLFPAVTEVLILVRMYKHFFTDEGYLTFTLPVKKTTLLGSKIMMSFIFNLSTLILLLADIFVILAIGIPREVFNSYFWAQIGNFISSSWELLGAGYSIVYITEIVLIILALLLTSNLVFFTCMTVASVLVRKHKVLIAIAIYYAVNSVMSGVLQFVMIEGSFAEAMNKIIVPGIDQAKFIFAMLLLVILGAVTAVGAIQHFLQSWLLERKLNLE